MIADGMHKTNSAGQKLLVTVEVLSYTGRCSGLKIDPLVAAG